MAASAGPQPVTNGLVLHLDAANAKNNAPLTAVEYLIVGGGGGGGFDFGGGGGAGGLLSGVIAVAPQAYTVTVGAGGTSGGPSITPTNGGNSSLFNLTALGGGRGANGSGANSYGPVGNGGSGGGAGGWVNANNAVFGLGTAGQGNNGGTALNGGSTATPGGGGGGGGAGSPGSNAPSNLAAGDGGVGILSNITGTNTFYAGGGGGGSYNTGIPGKGGLGGGGDASPGISTNAFAGVQNTGGGGGGNPGGGQGRGGDGGSGIVIIRYPGPQRATGGTVTQAGGDTVHTFTTVGNSTFTVLPAYANSQAFAGASDLSSNNNFGTAVNGPTYSTDAGGAYVFDGTNDYIATPFTYVNNNDYTMSCWIRASVAQRCGLMGIRRAFRADNWYQSQIYIAGDAESGTAGSFLQFSDFVRQSNGSYTAFRSTFTNTVSVTDNQWKYIVVTSDSVGARIYVNSVKIDESLSAPSPTRLEAAPFLVGAAGNWPNAPLAGYYFNGQMSGVSFYNRALTAAEISQNFEALRGRFGI